MSTPDQRFDPSALARYGNLSLIARLVVEGFLSGVHKSPFKGFSVEFAEHRQYYPGDEIRHIDWRAYGKTDRYYIKEHEEETNLHAHLLVDASGSMGYRGQGVSKLVYAQYVAATLAYLMLHQRDSVGLAVHDHAVARWFRHGRLQAIAAPAAGPRANTPRRRDGPGAAVESPRRPTPAPRHGRHPLGLLRVVAAALARAAASAALRPGSAAAAGAGAEEIEFPFDRLTQFRSLERDAEQPVLDARAARGEYLRNFETFCRELRTQAAGMQIDYHLLRTDTPVDRALGFYLSKRQRRP